MLFVIFILLIFALGIHLYHKFFKVLISQGTITVCTGAVKTGKSTLAVYLALRSYRRIHFRWKIVSKFKQGTEEPLLYSNIPLNCDYVPITTDILLRKQRINYKSVVLLDEASLIADSQFIRDNKVNLQLLKFFKLFGHFSRGGSLILDTQSISDLHYAIKRCVNNYCYIYKTVKVIPFFLFMYVLEQRYSDDGSIISVEKDDIQEHLKRVLVPKKTWKMFDTYCYSSMSDSLPSVSSVVDGKSKSLKTKNIPSFRDWSQFEDDENKE